MWSAARHLGPVRKQVNRLTGGVGSYRVIVDLIGATTTRTGLSVRCELDPNRYPKGVTVSDAEMAGLNIARDEFHGEWNYTLSPRPPDQDIARDEFHGEWNYTLSPRPPDQALVP